MSRTFTQYKPSGVLALRPEAFGAVYLCSEEDRTNIYSGDVAVVRVSGPLTAQRDCWFDSYPDLKLRFAEACASSAKRIVLVVSSPGGMCHEMLTTSRDLRAMSEAAGKEYIGYCDEMAYSAGYALLSSAQRVVISETGGAGSIGCIKQRVDFSKQNERAGVGVVFITSGAKKAFGNPDLPITDEEISDEQREVDQYAELFYQLISAHRGLSVDQVRAQEAGTYVGAAAVAAGLADAVGRLEDLLVFTTHTGANVSISEVMQALEAIAAGDGEDKEQAAKMIAAALTAEEPAEEPAPESEEPAEEEVQASDDAEPEPEPEPEEEEEDAPIAAAAMRAEIEALKAEVAKLAAVKARKPVVTTVAAKHKAAPVKSQLDLELDRAFGLDTGVKQSVTREGNAIVFR